MRRRTWALRRLEHTRRAALASLTPRPSPCTVRRSELTHAVRPVTAAACSRRRRRRRRRRRVVGVLSAFLNRRIARCVACAAAWLKKGGGTGGTRDISIITEAVKKRDELMGGCSSTPPSAASTKKRPNPPNTELRRFYERGDLPVVIDQKCVCAGASRCVGAAGALVRSPGVDAHCCVCCASAVSAQGRAESAVVEGGDLEARLPPLPAHLL
jgi:hypothetical protein